MYLVPATPQNRKKQVELRPTTKFKKFTPQPPRRVETRPSTLVSSLANAQALTSLGVTSEITKLPPTRDNNLALIESVPLGPKDHKPLPTDPNFEKFEPNSGINLLSRQIPHEDLQAFIEGRYYLPPSLLYSVVRLQPNKQAYDVPLEGEWLTIAIVAERGQIKLTDGSNETKKRKRVDDDDGVIDAPKRRKYINLSLVDLGPRPTTESTTTTRGDSLLTLLLFESDSSSVFQNEGKAQTVYKGGSGGAFEACAKLREGSVIAILNPRILKPFQRTNPSNIKQATTNMLAITPENEKSILVIGQARDLGMCNATRKDGKPCGSWCDKRVNSACEYHVLQAVQRRRASRPEFSVGTSGISSSKADPSKKWGLLPAGGPIQAGDSGPTYVLDGYVLHPKHAEDLICEKLGRNKQKEKRAAEEAALVRLLAKADRESPLALALSQKDAHLLEKAEREKEREQGSKPKGRIGYSAEAIKRIGFDPARTVGQEKEPETKLNVLASLGCGSGSNNLGPRPGKRFRSGVVVSPDQNPEKGVTHDRLPDVVMVDLDSDD